jgi:4-hydroxybenzoate polyprenyltransferase
LWTIGYDTIYAHQDKEDDAMLGLKSTALKFGAATKPWLAAFYAGAVVLWALAAWLASAGPVFYAVLAVIALQLAWQTRTLLIDDSANCLVRFKSNRWVGWLMFAGIAADMAVQWAARAG